MRKAFVIYALVTCIGALLCSCSWQKASVKEGIFDVYAPAPYTGAAFSMDEKSSAMRISLQIRKNDKETWQLEGIENDPIHSEHHGKSLDKSDANIAYRFKRFPITGSFDYFSKNRISLWGAGIGLDPYPFIRGAVGINSRHIEAGITAYLNMSMNTSTNKISWISHHEGMMSDEDHEGTEEGQYQEVKFNGGIGGFVSYFPIKSIAISYAPFLYRPWWDDEVRDYEVSFRFPCIISQYFGASILIAKHLQVSAGTTLYLSTAVKGSYWFFDSGVGFIF